MRNSDQVFSQILGFAQAEECVRAVMMNGSGVNPNAPKDIWQDYDIVFFIRDFRDMPYQANQDWIKQFGELCIKQVNEEADVTYFLLQFKDGIRIDLSFRDVVTIKDIARQDSLSKILLDKDALAPALPPPNDSAYHVQKPTEQEFADLINEAFWIMPYITKGIHRDELPYAKYMFDVVLLGCIRKLLCWYIGAEHNWSVNPGAYEKWFKRYLPIDIYNEFTALFPATDYKEMQNSLIQAGEFIRKIGITLANQLCYYYPIQDDEGVMEFITRKDRI